jgi:hypothetical protein
MSVERLEYLPQDTRVTFELQGSLPILREEYVSPQAGRVVLKGIFNQSAHIQLLDGSRYRTLSPRKIAKHPTDLVYPVVRLPDRVEVLQLRTPLRLEQGQVPRLRYITALADQGYVFRQISPGRRGFELWDSMEMEKLVNRESRTKLMPDLVLLSSVPVLLVMLFPWLDSQTIMYRQP